MPTVAPLAPLAPLVPLTPLTTLAPLTPSTITFEWPTWLLIVVVYSSWFGGLYWYSETASPVALVLLFLNGAWYLSLQHEIVHGHPTRFLWLNRWLGLMPIAVWYPFDVFRQTHLAHHNDAHLTYPDKDPESNYLEPTVFASKPRWLQVLLTFQRTSMGRFILGPAFAIGHLYREMASLATWSNPRLRWTWLQHFMLLALMLGGIYALTGLNPLVYLVAVAYPALGLIMMRSFYEHRPAHLAQHRIVINEAAWPWALLYLNNNYHAVHHDQPQLAWYAIPAAYRAHKARYLETNGGFYERGYLTLIWRHGLTPIDQVAQSTRDLPPL